MVPSPGARHVQQLPLCVVLLSEIRFVCHGLYAFLYLGSLQPICSMAISKAVGYRMYNSSARAAIRFSPKGPFP